MVVSADALIEHEQSWFRPHLKLTQLNQVIINAAAGTHVLNASGALNSTSLSQLEDDLDQDQGDASVDAPGRLPIYGSDGQIGGYIKQQCYSALDTMEAVRCRMCTGLFLESDVDIAQLSWLC